MVEQPDHDPPASPTNVEPRPEFAASNVALTTSPTATDHSHHTAEQSQGYGSDDISIPSFSYVLQGSNQHDPEGSLNEPVSPPLAVLNLNLTPESRLDEEDLEQLTSYEPFTDRGHFFRHFFDIICPLQCIFPNPTILIRKCVLCISASHYSQDSTSVVDGLVDQFSNAVTALLGSINKLEISENASTHQSFRHDASEEAYADSITKALLASILLGLYSVRPRISLLYATGHTCCARSQHFLGLALTDCQSYRDPEDLGVLHLNGARKLFQWWIQHHTRSNEVVADLPLDEEKHFIIGVMAWWEAHTAFVMDQSLDSLDYLEPFISEQATMTVHPFTGLSTPIFIILAQVGTCLRQQRLLNKVQKLSWPEDVLRSMQMQLTERTIRLERLLLDFVFPKIEIVRGLEHSKNPASAFRELICYGQIYQLVSLLELYRNFHSLDSSFEYASPRPFGTVDFPVSPSQDYQQFNQRVSQEVERREAFNSLAMTLFNLIEELPDAHESHLHQTLAFLISGSILHLPANIDHPPHADAGTMAMPWSNLRGRLAAISGRTEVILRWRKLIMRKLQINKNSCGLKSVYKRAESILENVWTKVLPPGQWIDTDPRSQLLSGPYWVDVMEECRLETNFA
ncbi:hypothetical protein MRS44_009658 [Fusarium solani]|uniref:uncharacterized protein n=1 Tax=Fusarium solani TaxID=169388 RepID=UPI0032C3E189|nr:hypothetical protein MRS44_009658 [Fusarium solani]